MVQLEWQIDSKRGGQRLHQEDPQEKRQRRRKTWQFLGVLLVFFVIVGGMAWLVAQRLDQVQKRYEQLLAETVQAEVATLRIGDLENFNKLQRSATVDWGRLQEQTFALYQARKAQTDIQLTGRVLSLVTEGQRGRVQVEELEGGVPYVQTWFYWRYDEVVVDEQVMEAGGWHHVPPDYTFWGEPAQISSQAGRFVVRYRLVDALFATQVAQSLEAWVAHACTYLICGELSFITVDILPIPTLRPSWQAGDVWQLLLPSPYVGRARADKPFELAQQVEVATLLATRLLDQLVVGTQPASDASFLRGALLQWLVGEWVQVGSQSYLLASVAQLYDAPAIQVLFGTLQPNDGLERLAQALNTSNLAEVPLDWRDFLTWRLRTENALIAQRDESNWVRFVDTRQDEARISAYNRYNANQPNLLQEVVSVTRQTTPDGVAQLRAVVQDSVNAPLEIRFNWVNGTWLRAD